MHTEFVSTKKFLSDSNCLVNKRQIQAAIETFWKNPYRLTKTTDLNRRPR